MKIGILTFPIEKVGGIITNAQNLIKGFQELGHSIETYYITTNTTKKPEKNDFNWKCLGFEKDEWYEEYLDKINKLDLIIWEVCCPHLTKSYNKKNWIKCFNVKPSQLAYIHDNYYNKYYPWYKDIPLQCNIKLICPYQYMYDSIYNLRAMKTIIDNPIEILERGLYTEIKKNILVDHNNWKGIKHKEIIVEQANSIECQIILYGSHETLEYREITKHSNFNKIMDKGWGTRSEIYENLKGAKVVTDLCKRQNVNTIYDYTITEAIAFGCIPILQTTICPNHKNIFVEYIKHPNQLSFVVNKIMHNFSCYETKREENLLFLNKIIPTKICTSILEYSKIKYQETNHNNSLENYF